MGVGKKGMGPTGRVNNRLHRDDSFKLMRWVDTHKARIDKQMTYQEVIDAVKKEVGLEITRGNVEGVLRDFGLAVKPTWTPPPTGQTRAGVERVRSPQRIVLTTLETYKLDSWVRDQRDRIDRTMTYEDIIAEVKTTLGLEVGRGNLYPILRDLGLKTRKNVTACPIGLSGRPDGEPDLSETTRGKTGAWKRAARLARLEERFEELATRLSDVELAKGEGVDQTAWTAIHGLSGATKRLTEAQEATNDSLRGILARLKAVEERPAGVAGAAHNVVVGRVAKLEERAAARDKLVDHDLAQFQRTLADLLDRVRKLEGAVGGPEAVGS